MRSYFLSVTNVGIIFRSRLASRHISLHLLENIAKLFAFYEL